MYNNKRSMFFSLHLKKNHESVNRFAVRGELLMRERQRERKTKSMTRKALPKIKSWNYGIRQGESKMYIY